MLKALFPILLALFVCVPVLAQQAPFGGHWHCGPNRLGEEQLECFVACPGYTGPGLISRIDPPGFHDCPHEQLGIRWNDLFFCEGWFEDTMPAVCFPPGSHPDEFVIPEQKFHERALLAFGVAFAAGVAVNALAPHLPEELSLVPEVKAAYRDGLMMTSAELTADWRNWTLSASAANFQGEWSRPYAKVQWTWAF